MTNERKRMRFELLLERFFSNFHRILLTNLLFAIPSAIVFGALYALNNVLFHGAISLPLSLTAIILLYPFYSGVVMVCRNIARGDTEVKVVKTYFSAVKSNFWHFLVHGIIIYIIVTFSTLAVSVYVGFLSSGWFFYVLLFFSILIALMLLFTIYYIPLMSVTYDLPLRYIYKNSLLMSFGEFKNNIFATIAAGVVFGICFTAVAFIRSATVLAIVVSLLWALLLPAAVTFMIVFFIYDGMTNIMRNKEDISGELTEKIEKGLKEQEEKKAAQAAQPVKDDFSDIDISSLKDTDDYIFHNGKMVKQSTLLKMIREQQKKAGESQSAPSDPAE